MPATVAIDGKVENKYPKILGVTDKRFFKDDDIIENRNKFVEEFGITKSVYRLHKYELLENLYLRCSQEFKGEIDHPELYQTSKLELILICSNYTLLPPKGLGMTRYADLYAKNCPTYMRIFQPGTWQNMKNWLKQREKIAEKSYFLTIKSKNLENQINGTDLRPSLLLPTKNTDGGWR